MEFLKAHWVPLACGVVSLAAVVVLILGLLDDDVVVEMNKRVSAAAQIQQLAANPKNDEVIAAEQRRGERFKEQYENVVRQTAEFNRRVPLLEGVFPKPAQEELRYRFKEEYKDQLYELPRDLGAGDLPTPQDVQDVAEVMADEARRKAEQGEPSTPEPAAPPLPGGPPGLGPPGLGPPGKGGLGGPPPGWGGGPPPGWGGMPPPGWGGGPPGGRPPPGFGGGPPGGPPVTEAAQQRAAVKKAREIQVYASLDRTRPSFHISPIVDTLDAPSPREMWYAQVSLWIQQDFVRAVRMLNEAFARNLGDKPANVTTLPVKRIVELRVLGYITPTGALLEIPAAGVQSATGAGGAASPAAEAGPSLTGRKSDEQFDVVRFTTTVVVDQRYLTQLIDAVTRVNFYQCIDLDFTTQNTDERAAGYYYGPDPVVRATLTFEGYMARKIYKELMPPEVLQDLGAAESPAGP